MLTLRSKMSKFNDQIERKFQSQTKLNTNANILDLQMHKMVFVCLFAFLYLILVFYGKSLLRYTKHVVC